MAAAGVAIVTINTCIAIQEVSQRERRVTDFRLVQGSINIVAISNLLAGFAGTIAIGCYPSTVGGVSITGVAARSVGVCAGIILLGLALSPKALAILIAIPPSVTAAFVVALLGLIFLQGMRNVAQSGLDTRVSLLVTLPFWIGFGFYNSWISPDLLSGAWETMLSDGITAGSVVAIVFTLLTGLSFRRRRRLIVEHDESALAKIDSFLNEFASNVGWNEASVNRLRAAGEETLASLQSWDGVQDSESGRRLTVNARHVDRSIEIEFIAASEGTENIEDRLSYIGDTRFGISHLSDAPEMKDEREISYRLLRHYAASVQHHKYQDIDIITVRVEDMT